MSRECDFCRIDNLRDRVVHDLRSSSVFSILSNPSLTDFHTLVIPRRHVDPANDVLTEEEVRDEAFEKDRLREIFMKMGFKGVDFFQKNRPWVAEGANGTKMDHHHTHVLPSRPGSYLYEHGIPWGMGGWATKTASILRGQLTSMREAERQMGYMHGSK